MPMRIMVVDDSAFMRGMVVEALDGLDCRVVGEAADGEEAVTRYKELHPDIVTLDLIMPVKSGLDALQEIREFDPQAKIVVVTAIEQRKPLLEALRLGAIDYVVKPFEKERIEEAIERIRTGQRKVHAAHSN